MTCVPGRFIGAGRAGGGAGRSGGLSAGSSAAPHSGDSSTLLADEFSSAS